MEGGVLFMGMLSIVLLVILALAVKSIIFDTKNEEHGFRNQIGYIKSLGLFAVVLGMLGQFIGLFTAFEYIAATGSVSPAILAGGFKVSSITSIYGIIIFLIAYLLWFGISSLKDKKA